MNIPFVGSSDDEPTETQVTVNKEYEYVDYIHEAHIMFASGRTKTIPYTSMYRNGDVYAFTYDVHDEDQEKVCVGIDNIEYMREERAIEEVPYTEWGSHEVRLSDVTRDEFADIEMGDDGVLSLFSEWCQLKTYDMGDGFYRVGSGCEYEVKYVSPRGDVVFDGETIDVRQ